MAPQTDATTADQIHSIEALVGNAIGTLRERNGWTSIWDQRLEGADRGEEFARLIWSLGDRYESATLDGFEIYDRDNQVPVIDRLKTFALEMPDHLRTGGGVILIGRPGVGKDHLAAALLKIAVAKHGLRVRWWDGMSLFAAARKAIANDDEQGLIRELVEPHIVCLSDPQPPTGVLTDYQLRLLRDALDRRYRRRASTWLTTNVDRPEDAEALLTAPLLDRLKEGSGQIVCDWASYRQRQRAAW